jgi:hypothetical protein
VGEGQPGCTVDGEPVGAPLAVPAAGRHRAGEWGRGGGRRWGEGGGRAARGEKGGDEADRWAKKKTSDAVVQGPIG